MNESQDCPKIPRELIEKLTNLINGNYIDNNDYKNSNSDNRNYSNDGKNSNNDDNGDSCNYDDYRILLIK